MRFSTLCSLLAVAGWTSASPLRARQASANATDPGLVLLTLLEEAGLTFWKDLIDAFDDQSFEDAGFSPGLIRDQIVTAVVSDKTAHFEVLQSLLGTQSPNCVLDVSPGLTDVTTALLTGRQLELIAVGAYIGIIASEPQSPNVELFTEILANEGESVGILNLALANQAQTHAFELGLTVPEVFTMFSPFNVTCTRDLGIPVNPPLVITNNGTVTNTTTLTFDLDGTPCADQLGLFCQILNGDDATSTPLPIDQCSMAGQAGGNYIYVTTDNTTLSADPLQRTNVTSLCAGPKLVLVDNLA